jgi:hypothetical protein
VSCAAVWALILAAGKRWSDPEDWERLRMTCGGWWMGWTSASIARVAFPPAKQLDAAAEKKVADASLALVALGVGSVVRYLVTGRRATRRVPE